MMTSNAAEMVGSRIEEVNNELQNLGAPFSVQFMSSVKPNLGEVFGFCTKPRINDDMMHPIIYWEKGFSDLSNRQLAVHIIHRYLDASKEMIPGFPEIISRDYILTNVLPKVIGTDENIQSMAENEIPYEMISGTDLMAVYYIPVEQTCGTIQITQQILDLVGISKEEMSDSAKKNVLDQMIIKPMAEIMAEMMGVDYIPELDNDSDGIGLTVVTNKAGMYGAGVLVCKEAYIRMSRYIGSDILYILPSSLHEVLIVKSSDTFSQDDLLQMVTEINGTVVETADRLTDNVYRYDATTGEITHCK